MQVRQSSKISFKLVAVLAVFVLVAAAVTLTACSSGDDEEPDEAADVADKEVAETIEVETLDLADTALLLIVPAPSEIITLVDRDDVYDQLADRLGEPLPSYDTLPEWQRALALGRVVADLMVSAREVSDGELAELLANTADGLRSLGADAEQVARIEELQARVASGGISRDRLVQSFDRMRADVFRSGSEQLGDRNTVLVAIGGWARAVNLVSNLTLDSGEVPAGADVLKLRIIVSTLIDKLGDGEEVRPIAEALRAILPMTAHVPSDPTEQELRTLVAETDEILAYTRTS